MRFSISLPKVNKLQMDDFEFASETPRLDVSATYKQPFHRHNFTSVTLYVHLQIIVNALSFPLNENERADENIIRKTTVSNLKACNPNRIASILHRIRLCHATCDPTPLIP